MCRCNCCGDSEKNSRKRRAYILKTGNRNDGMWVYYCHNDDCDANSGILVTTWLKRYFPSLYDEYRRENYINCKSEKLREETPLIIEPYDESKDIKYFRHINSSDEKLFVTAREYCSNRKIPENIWSKWFVCIDGRFQGRLVIPFYDTTGSIYYYQCRSLIGQEPKYLNRKSENGEKEIYNIHFVDKTKPIMVTEGPIDSMFLENSIATLGVKFTTKVRDILSGLNCYYILDNDDAGKKISKIFLEDGKNVFNWKRFLKDQKIDKPIKDVNDYILISGHDKLMFSDLKKYFTNTAFDKVWFV
jgi:hypothetical protein